MFFIVVVVVVAGVGAGPLQLYTFGAIEHMLLVPDARESRKMMCRNTKWVSSILPQRMEPYTKVARMVMRTNGPAPPVLRNSCHAVNCVRYHMVHFSSFFPIFLCVCAPVCPALRLREAGSTLLGQSSKDRCCAADHHLASYVPRRTDAPIINSINEESPIIYHFVHSHYLLCIIIKKYFVIIAYGVLYTRTI